MIRTSILACLFACLLPASPDTKLPRELNGIGFDQKLDAPVPLDTVFRDETGQTVTLRQFFQDKPVILATVYYRCPMLCSQILSGVVRGLRPLSLKPGRDFEIV
ncbi:MAG: hypothetical protein JO182_11085, partial [Acidobacteriaceae bacterium]|nr:hypothetical protein [Acidobacteriaceae bacterium]